jgi:hypothetical protein
MPIVACEGDDRSRCRRISERREAMRITVARMRLTAAQCRRSVEETRSTLTATTASIREVDALLQTFTFQLQLMSINRASPAPAILC